MFVPSLHHSRYLLFLSLLRLSFLYVLYVMPGAALSRHILELATEPGGVGSFSVKEWAWVSLSSPIFISISEVLFYDLGPTPLSSPIYVRSYTCTLWFFFLLPSSLLFRHGFLFFFFFL